MQLVNKYAFETYICCITLRARLFATKIAEVKGSQRLKYLFIIYNFILKS